MFCLLIKNTVLGIKCNHDGFRGDCALVPILKKNCKEYEKNQNISHFCYEAKVESKYYEPKCVINMVWETITHLLKNKNKRENIRK